MKAFIQAIEFYLPETVLKNNEISAIFPEWPADKIKNKTGISVRYIASDDICASDLAFKAAEKLFATQVISREEIDFILLCTQSPDYLLPTSACLLQDRLNLPKFCGALDFNLGCSGYIYGLGLAKGLIETNQATNILLLTADTYTKYLDPTDVSTRTIFSDGASATLISKKKSIQNDNYISEPLFGTDGSGAKNLILKKGGTRYYKRQSFANEFLYMNGSEIFLFIINNIPQLINNTLKKGGLKIEEIDLFIFHQANQFILEHLREKIKIPKDKFYISIENFGNTVSSSIPIALHCAQAEKKLSSHLKIMLVGFGVGYSWGSVIVHPFLGE
ncbi:MAG TPA: ketoacyl-ACP synthase III [Patescibacteria group bacterium]|nr:ketoacyl-ACP synthase III [Gammaproteobacteria bacterium]HWA51500.1 ketoacyl-ACP synthase III [Patescibacteria group bacterium]